MATTVTYDAPAVAHRPAIDPADEQALLEQARSTFDFRYVVAAIRSNLLLIGAIIALCVALAVIVTMLQTPRYTAGTTVQINNSVNRVLKSDDDAEASEMGGWDVDRNLKTQVEILKSRGLAQRVVQKLNLASNHAASGQSHG